MMYDFKQSDPKGMSRVPVQIDANLNCIDQNGAMNECVRTLTKIPNLIYIQTNYKENSGRR